MNIFDDVVRHSRPRPLSIWPIVLGWILFIAALFAPSVEQSAAPRSDLTEYSGWQCVWLSILMSPSHPVYVPFAVSNLVMTASPFYAARALGGACVKQVTYWMGASLVTASIAPLVIDRLLVGYYLWLASFVCVAIGFFAMSHRQKLANEGDRRASQEANR